MGWKMCGVIPYEPTDRLRCCAVLFTDHTRIRHFPTGVKSLSLPRFVSPLENLLVRRTFTSIGEKKHKCTKIETSRLKNDAEPQQRESFTRKMALAQSLLESASTCPLKNIIGTQPAHLKQIRPDRERDLVLSFQVVSSINCQVHCEDTP
jgi:hypothetical protein